MREPTDIAAAFDVAGRCVAAEPFGSGHINDSFAVTFDAPGGASRYLLQRINTDVFKNVDGLMSNIARVCAHTRAKLAAAGAADADRRTLTLIPTRDGGHYHRDDADRCWRMYRLIEGARGYDTVETPAQAYTAARAFGAFQNLLTDLPGDRLVETIPDFHHTPKRLKAFDAALEADARNRAADARREIDWLQAHRATCGALLRLRDEGLAPERVTHNDTKLANVLIDERTQEAICVIDLDTVMPGLSLYDFGDLVRSSTSPVAEDEPDASRVTMQMPMFEALARGYLAEAGRFLTPAEVDALPLAGEVITLTMGIRFLTDYLAGDIYYKTRRPGHNLDRCRTQWALVDSMRHQERAMRAAVASIAATG